MASMLSKGPKSSSILHGPQKALFVLHNTVMRAGAGSLSDTTGKFEPVIKATVDKLLADGRAPTMPGRGAFVLEVQYNPASINITANADTMPIKPLQPAFDSNVPLSASVGPAVIMMIELIFDDIVVTDAFMSDKFNLSAGNVANDAMMIADAAMSKVHSVKPQTNGLLAAMQRTNTRSVSLYWADMHFHGNIQDMQAKYTMFSVSGRPIRSVVNMTLVQDSGKSDEVINGYWEDALDKIFPDVDPAAFTQLDESNYSARGMAQKSGALTNINF